MKFEPKFLLLLAFLFELVGTVYVLQKEIAMRQNAESFPDCINCYLLLVAVALLLFAFLVSRLRSNARVLSFFASIGSLVLNLFFLIDGVEKRRAVIYLVNEEILHQHYLYWEKFRFAEYSICFASFLTIIAIVFLLLQIRERSSTPTVT
ncbi:MAG: hypothetical protein ACKVQW_10005 [Pyrinomonadaceae bacterium]